MALAIIVWFKDGQRFPFMYSEGLVYYLIFKLRLKQWSLFSFIKLLLCIWLLQYYEW